jgi:CRISPR/Cas system-associated exonuclease Cas4 (RecB family)
MKTSYSRLNAFSFCPKKYEYRYVLDTPAPGKPELAFGVALHAALEHNFRQKQDTRQDLPVDTVTSFFRKELEEHLASVPDDTLRGATDTHYLRSMGEHFLEQFLRERSPQLMPAPRGVECFFQLPLSNGYNIVGQFDLLDTDWVLHDFKTSKKPYDSRTADRTQLVLYAWACERLFGRYPKALCFDVFVKGDGADGKVEIQEPVMVPVPSVTEMAQVARSLERQLETIQTIATNGIFPRAFAPLRCHWCEYQTPCVQDWDDTGRPLPQRIRLGSLT